MVRANFHVSPFLCVGWGTVLRRCSVYSLFITGLPRNLPSLLNISENFHSFLKKVVKKFGGYKKIPYLCNRF